MLVNREVAQYHKLPWESLAKRPVYSVNDPFLEILNVSRQYGCIGYTDAG